MRNPPDSARAPARDAPPPAARANPRSSRRASMLFDEANDVARGYFVQRALTTFRRAPVAPQVKTHAKVEMESIWGCGWIVRNPRWNPRRRAPHARARAARRLAAARSARRRATTVQNDLRNTLPWVKVTHVASHAEYMRARHPTRSDLREPRGSAESLQVNSQ